MSTAVHQRITDLLAGNRVVLFMKGTPDAPRCGFSSRAVGLLHSLDQPFLGVDVLSDDEIRQGIKDFGNWPTIPQLYIDGELLGGSDIIAQMHGSGELHQLLGIAAPDRTAPTIEITAAAAQAIRAGMSDDPGLSLHLEIDSLWRAQFQLAAAEGHEIVASDQGIKLLMNPDTATRARGMQIDWVDSMQGSGLSVRLPGAPPPVKALQVEALRDHLNAGSIKVIDVRPQADRERAPFAAASVLDASTFTALSAWPHDSAIAFLCHYGNSSRQAAEQFRALGFRDVYNVEGGIDAWSQRIDATIARY